MTDLTSKFAEYGQDHVFAFAEDLSPEGRRQLERQAENVDLAEIQHLYQTLVGGDHAGNENIADELSPADFVLLPNNGGDADLWQKARETGEQALRDGRVAAFVVAGGQGTRLGYDGPKGTFPVTPVVEKSLFQVFAEKILAATKRYGKPIPWFVMCSDINYEPTVEFFEKHHYFGLKSENVHFFSQGLMPAVDAKGKIILSEKDSLALSPDGHGGSLRALVRSGSVDRMKEMGIDIISYFQVDNPLVRCVDPEFIGFHLLNESELSSKALPKAYPEEKVGVFCERNGKSVVIEYSDLPQRLAEERDKDGELTFRAGSIAIHVFDREFVNRLGTGQDESAKLPFHRAHKKVPFVDSDGTRHEPQDPNGYKFEMFVFDALPFAKNPVIIETAREDDFSPVKNAEGVDSPDTSRKDQLRQFARWMKAAGIDLAVDETGLPEFTFEVSPLFADTEDRFIEAWNELEIKPPLTDGLVLA